MNPALLVDLYELTMAQSYFIYKKETLATFDLFVRSLPKNRAYLVACGLEDILHYLKNLKFGQPEIAYLKAQRLFSQDFLKYLSGFRFRGDVYALREGTVFFANEPLIRVTANIIEAQIIESFLLNTINLQTMLASKASRVVSAAKGRPVFDFSLRRTHGQDAGLKASRCTFIAGCSGTSNVLAGKLYKIPIVGTMAHSFVMSFRGELDSFLAYASTFPECTTLLVDTYNTSMGIQNAIKIGLYLKAKGCRLQGIRLDSGDIASLSKSARRMLDRAGLKYVKIFASGNLDEFKIKDLLDRSAEVDSFGVGTNMGTSIDSPSLDVIYKISEVTDDEDRFLPTMKLSKAKVTYPGRKQIFRVRGREGKFIKDILGLEKEKIKGKALLIKVIEKGKVIYKIPSLNEIRAYLKNNLAKFTPTPKKAPLFKVGMKWGIKILPQKSPVLQNGVWGFTATYPVAISPKLKKLRSALTEQLKYRQ